MNIQLRIAARTARGLVRPNNGDVFLATDLTRGENSTTPRWAGRMTLGDRGALLAVADGKGQAGDVASSLVVSALAEAMASQDCELPSCESLTGAVEDAHRLAWTQTCQQGIEMGATLAAAYVRGPTLSVVEVGDSRAYLIREGQITRLARTPSSVRVSASEGRPVPVGNARGLPFRNVILQALGTCPEAAVFASGLVLRHRDYLLLCSDGLSCEVPELEIRDLVLDSPGVDIAADRLVDFANECGGCDNTTVLLAGVWCPKERIRETGSAGRSGDGWSSLTQPCESTR